MSDEVLNKTGSKEEMEKEAIRAYFDHQRKGVCVEVGSNEPKDACSQSWHLEDQLGWRCVLVEPNPELAQKARDERPDAVVYECACVGEGHVGEVTLYIPVSTGDKEHASHASIEKNMDEHAYAEHREVAVKGRTLSSIFEEEGLGEVELLSIDVEGAEYEVIKGLVFSKWQPKLILLEDKHLYLNKHRYLKRHGYQLLQRLNRNCWYVPAGAKGVDVSFGEKMKLFKRMYLSIWFKKLGYAFKHRTLRPFKTL